jgi:lipoprotein-anchoring transpeptidase ErfK/SrfK
MRYGVGIGREGFSWSGHGYIGRKAEWPTWTPPAEMVARDPNAAPYKNGMPGGTNNPLGARAMYIYTPSGSDSLYRVHGTNDPASIGSAVSSGCVRLIDQDVIDLYGRVPVGAKIVVI